MMRFTFSFAHEGGVIVLPLECYANDLAAACRRLEAQVVALVGCDVTLIRTRMFTVRREAANA